MAGAANSKAAPAATPPAIAPVAPFPPEVSINLNNFLHMIQTIFNTILALHHLNHFKKQSIQTSDQSLRSNFQDSFYEAKKIFTSSGINKINFVQKYSTSNNTEFPSSSFFFDKSTVVFLSIKGLLPTIKNFLQKGRQIIIYKRTKEKMSQC